MKKNWTDQELQDLFENDPKAFDALARTNEDARLYALLFTTFPTLDTPEVPSQFSERVLARLEVKEAKAQKGYSLWLTVAIGLTTLAGLALAWILAPQMGQSFQVIGSYLPFLAAAALVFFGLELLDQKVVWSKADETLVE
jgi:hypothetical protein